MEVGLKPTAQPGKISWGLNADDKIFRKDRRTSRICP